MRPSCRRAIAWLSLTFAACGSPDGRGVIDPTGGEVCASDRKVCLRVVSGGITEAISVGISSSSDGPPAALSETWDIAVQGKSAYTFLKPAQVVFKLDDALSSSVSDVNLLRVNSREDGGDWASLDHCLVDRVKGEVLGETGHLSPFVVLRADRLPDGGVPIEGDGGFFRDSGVIVIPPLYDAGRPDSGTRDAGTPDSGVADAGPRDAGPPDAGSIDAGPPDAGPLDAGPPDAGPIDAGAPDAGPLDAGPPDAGAPDAGPPDAGAPDAGPPDAGPADSGMAVDAGPDDAGVADAGANDGG